MPHQHKLIVPYSSNKQLGMILEVIFEHNDRIRNPHKYATVFGRYGLHEQYKQIEPGANLTSAELVSFWKHEGLAGGELSACHGPVLSRGVTCIANGDHDAVNRTYAFLQWHLLRKLPDVYFDGVPAITAYACDELVHECLHASFKAVADERIHAPGIVPTLVDQLVRGCCYTTRQVIGNPAFRDLMMELEPGQTRKQKMNLHPKIAPYLSRYHDVYDGWMVAGVQFANESRREAVAYAEILLGRCDSPPPMALPPPVLAAQQ